MMSMHGGTGTSGPISVQIHGDDSNVLRSLADEAAAIIKDVPGGHGK